MVHKISAVILLALVSLLLLDRSAHSAAISGRDHAELVNFMMQYGYLEPKNPRLGEFRTKEDLDRAIKQLQEFAGLKVTGKIDAATVKLIRTPRCSMPDFGPSDNMKKRRKRYALHDSQWKKLHLTYRVLNTSTEELSKPQVRATLRKAFDLWTEVSPLRFTEIFSGEADIRISFESRKHGDGYFFDGRGATIAHAFYPHDNRGVDGDVHFDDEEHWTLDKPRVGTDFMWTAVHEIGHAIGVEHSTYWDAIMYPYYTGYKPNIKLHEDDVMAIQAKYGKPPVSTVPPTTDPSSKVSGPSPCKTSFDAVFHSKDGNTYFFKENYFWTVDNYNRILGGREIKDFWPQLRARVQAAYTRRDGKTVFFKGRRYWVFEGTKYIEGPKLITEYGLPIELKRLDAVFIWGGNGKTYFFKGNKYWRYNENTKKLDSGYPKEISEGWGAVRQPVDSVMTGKDGNSYFFNGLNFSKFEFHKSHLYRPQKIAQFFFNCEGENAVQVDDDVEKGDDDDEEDKDGGDDDDEEDKDGGDEKQVDKEINEENDKNGVSRATMFAPLMALLAIVTSLSNYCW